MLMMRLVTVAPIRLATMIPSESQTISIVNGATPCTWRMTPCNMTAMAPMRSAMKKELKIPTMIEP